MSLDVHSHLVSALSLPFEPSQPSFLGHDESTLCMSSSDVGTSLSPAPSLTFSLTRSPTPLSSIDDPLSPKLASPFQRVTATTFEAIQQQPYGLVQHALNLDTHPTTLQHQTLELATGQHLHNNVGFNSHQPRVGPCDYPLAYAQPSVMPQPPHNTFAALSQPSHSFVPFNNHIMMQDSSTALYNSNSNSNSINGYNMALAQPVYHPTPPVAPVPVANYSPPSTDMTPLMSTPSTSAMPTFSSIETPAGTFYFVPHKTAAEAVQVLSNVAATPNATQPTLVAPQPVIARNQAPHAITTAIALENATADQDTRRQIVAQQTSKMTTTTATATATNKKSSAVVAPKTTSSSTTKKPRKPRSTVKRFVCPQTGCGRAFARNFNMQSHLKSHFDLREWDCPVCPKKFSRRHDRGRHCSTVHGINKDDYQRKYHQDSIDNQDDFDQDQDSG
ncbi:hypothetical protein OIO90_001417 [Microbotryomycetes sp. JL221]|nr:hypothetical protein OIO90_001417 [Microbotryomycetes sp. JL221]